MCLYKLLETSRALMTQPWRTSSRSFHDAVRVHGFSLNIRITVMTVPFNPKALRVCLLVCKYALRRRQPNTPKCSHIRFEHLCPSNRKQGSLCVTRGHSPMETDMKVFSENPLLGLSERNISLGVVYVAVKVLYDRWQTHKGSAVVINIQGSWHQPFFYLFKYVHEMGKAHVLKRQIFAGWHLFSPPPKPKL